MIILCSSSPTRAMLLRSFGVPFIQKSPDYDEEQITTECAREFVYTASKGKLEAAIREFGLETPLLAADTVIATHDGNILRKPKNLDDARAILQAQSGNEISIITSLHYRSTHLLFTDISATHYTFAPFDTDKLEAYLQSHEWDGKAGGCMVEGFCKEYITKVTGLESTAMGLQVERVLGWMG
jgi:septum formation protein